jgi:molybdopterin-guanine dinucleotide biosynthesis protein A
MITKSTGFDLVIPIWPDGKLEAIHAVYNRKNIMPVLTDLWRNQTLELWRIAKNARRTLFVPTEELAETDPPLLSLLDADTAEEFEALTTAKTAHGQGRHAHPFKNT